MARIVVIDDSKLIRSLLQHILEQAGYEVEVWEEVTAAEIPDRIQAGNPDLILTDYQMPGSNGLTLARMARKTRPGLPVIVVTASHDPAVMDALHRVEVAYILHKPIHAEELLQVVRKALPPVAG
ncbi:MAG: response regulator [Geothrix sp.]|nr:response regulator [Geothrix sp.]